LGSRYRTNRYDLPGHHRPRAGLGRAGGEAKGHKCRAHDRRRQAGTAAVPLLGLRQPATIGVLDFGWLRLTGRLAWLAGASGTSTSLIEFRNRIPAALD